VKIKAANADGSVPKQVHVLLSAVDVGILNITDFKTPTRSPACSVARPTAPTSWTSTAS
jgi:hypothetical protein